MTSPPPLSPEQMLAALGVGPRAPLVPGLIPPGGGQAPALQAHQILALLAQPKLQRQVR